MTTQLGDARLPANFWRFVETGGATGCWLWRGSLNHAGYGRWAAGKRFGPPRLWRVHRLTYAALVAPIPTGLTIDHLCRVRNCCNPDHLEPVTQRENTLRGDTLNAANVLKTHCPQGHPYDVENTYVHSDGRRGCRRCRRESRRRHSAAARALRPAAPPKTSAPARRKPRPPMGSRELTPIQRDTLEHLVGGGSFRGLAAAAGINLSTAKERCRSLYKALGTKDRTAAIDTACVRGLVSAGAKR